MLQLLDLHRLRVCWALLRSGAVVNITEKAWLVAGHGFAALPTADLTTAGEITVSEQDAAGAPEDREGVGPNTVHWWFQSNPFREQALKFELNIHIGYHLPILDEGQESKCINHLNGESV